MSTIQYGINVVRGVQEPKEIIGAPDGKQRLRMRSREYARLFVKTENGIREFALQDCGFCWRPVFEYGRNQRL